MGQAQINVRTRACSRTSIARTRQAALTHNVRGKEINNIKGNWRLDSENQPLAPFEDSGPQNRNNCDK